MIKLLRLSSYCYPEQVSSSHLSKDLNQAMLANGICSVIYAPTPSRGVTKEVRKQYKKIKYEERNDGKTIIHRFAMFPEGKNPILRALRYLLINLIHYYKGSRAEGIDAIYCASTPPTQGFLCARVKRKLSKRYGRSVPLIFNLQDIFPDSLVNAKMIKKGGLIWKIGRRIEDYAYRNADRIIVISEDFKANIMAKGVPAEKIVVVSNWVNTENVYPVAREENVLFDRYGLDRDKFYICYSGNIGHSQNLDLLLRVAKDLQTELPQVRFVLIGEGAAKEEVQQKIKAEGHSNIIMLPFQDYAEIAHVFSLGDAGLIISKSGVGGSSVPSKTWSIMAAERPILASFDAQSDLSKLIGEINCGIAVDADDADGLKAAILTLMQDPALRAALGKNGRSYLIENLDKDTCTGQYVKTILDAVSNQQGEGLQ